MSNTLLFVPLLGIVLVAQAVTIYVVRRLVKRWCSDVYESGVRFGEKAGIEASEPFREVYQVGHDIGLERGHQEGYDEAVTDAVENPGTFTARLLEIRPGAADRARRWTDSGSGPGYEGE